jgi:heparan-alpha-glucosaminide N-acetyltransferase
MTEKKRMVSIDIMRGFTLFLMLFVNDLYVRDVPSWMVHTKADFDGMGLADWVFPGFLFMVGMSVPFAVSSRLKRGHSKNRVLLHILVRTLSLLIIGILMLNAGRLNPETSGMHKHLWAVLMYICVFLVWNHYPQHSSLQKWFLGLRIAGVAGLVILVALFRAGPAEDPSWLHTGWWGILGLIGWGYLAAALSYLFIGNRIWGIVAVWFVFTGLNVLSEIGLTRFLDPLKPVLGVLISGNTPSIVLAGLVISLVFQKYENKKFPERMFILVLLGLAALLSGFILRHWFIISKIKATPSWAMVCNGISLLLFTLIFLVTDVLKKVRWAFLFQWAGQNSLTTYLAPDILYYTLWGLGLPVFFYKQDASQWLAVAGSLVWAFLMVLFAILLSKIKIRLKL